MRVGWILKAGDFDCGSNQLSAALRLLLLVLFLQKQEKYGNGTVRQIPVYLSNEKERSHPYEEYV